MSMRVLCVHSEASSALQFSRECHQLEKRLWERHGIELVFVDGPLLDAPLGGAGGDCEEGGGADDDPTHTPPGGGGAHVSRRWYVEEEMVVASPPPPAAASGDAPPRASRYSGLDASLLHLAQIWTRGGANISANLGECLPFQGVLGVGQGASVAGLLPLLNYHEEDDDEKENVMTTRGRPAMFQGMQFAILVDGEDIISQRASKGEKEAAENDACVGPEGMRSLHVIAERDGAGDATRRRSSGERLARHYGPNAEVHRARTPTGTAPFRVPSVSNTVGRFLVARKKELRDDATATELRALQRRLYDVEQLAAVMIAREIQEDPPKALLAVVGPAAARTSAAEAAAADRDAAAREGGGTRQEDQEAGEAGQEHVMVDKAVGAWRGARRRGFGEEGGGAPCPGEFLLREDER